MLQDNPENYRGLTYPWGRRANPAPGVPEQVAEGVYWVRFPMPMSLDHINIWLLEDGDGWTVVDTCLNIPEAREIWEGMFSGFMQDKPVKRVICTHMHPDHVGLAGWLTERFNCALWMSRQEFLMCRNMVGDTGKPAPLVGQQFYRAAGFDEEQMERYRQRFGSFGMMISTLPANFRRLLDQETFSINGRYWQVVVGSGHSPEHVCLYCPAAKLLIAGDQILPRITPNVSLFPTEPEGNPLAEWLRTSASIRALLPDDLLVLPAHEAPFRGVRVRLTQIIENHERELDQLWAHLDEPRRAVDCFPALFKRAIDKNTFSLATGETLAHLNFLLGTRQITRTRDADGVDWYQQSPNSVDFDSLPVSG